MFSADFLKELKNQMQNPTVWAMPTVDEVLVAPAGWSAIDPHFPTPRPLQASTLTGMRDFILASKTQLDGPILSVMDERKVALISRLGNRGERYTRHAYLTAEAVGGRFGFGSYHMHELFVIGLQTLFAPTVERDALLALVGSIRDTKTVESTDDGIGQRVVVARGPALVERTAVPNSFVLQPYRTFQEIEQPKSQFILRIKGGDNPALMLVESDGGLWKSEAVQRIGAWLREQVKDVPVIA